MKIEIWKRINDYPDYEVSNLGRIKSLSRISTRGFKLQERIIKGGIDTRGYQMIHLSKKGIRKTFLVHRIVASHFIENPLNKEDVNHINGIKTDNYVSNLEWCTTKENVNHAFRIGLCKSKKGLKNGRALLTENEVLQIRKDKNKKICEIATKYNVSWSCISSIIKGKTWTHI